MTEPSKHAREALKACGFDNPDDMRHELVAIQTHIDAAVAEAVAPLVAAIDEKHFWQNRAEKAERELAQLVIAVRERQ